MIAMLKFTVAMLVLVGCGGATDVDDTAPPLFDRGSPECDGTQYAELCAGYHYGYAYGVPASCTTNPWRPAGDRAQFRKNDPAASVEQCGTFSQAGVTCCAE